MVGDVNLFLSTVHDDEDENEPSEGKKASPTPAKPSLHLECELMIAGEYRTSEPNPVVRANRLLGPMLLGRTSFPGEWLGQGSSQSHDRLRTASSPLQIFHPIVLLLDRLRRQDRHGQRPLHRAVQETRVRIVQDERGVERSGDAFAGGERGGTCEKCGGDRDNEGSLAIASWCTVILPYIKASDRQRC